MNNEAGEHGKIRSETNDHKIVLKRVCSLIWAQWPWDLSWDPFVIYIVPNWRIRSTSKSFSTSNKKWSKFMWNSSLSSRQRPWSRNEPNFQKGGRKLSCDIFRKGSLPFLRFVQSNMKETRVLSKGNEGGAKSFCFPVSKSTKRIL